MLFLSDTGPLPAVQAGAGLSVSFLGEPSPSAWERIGALSRRLSAGFQDREHSPTDLGVGLASVPRNSGQQARPMLPLKEVIQPHLPVQLPCYDFVPVTKPDLGTCLP